ncbi:hypothetical protein PDE_03504 [Penicillium oxalicum 114-2]|uniref:HhH-GPD domain-containing protein n=1 Tax=Penicillium oxalicum (strain 114-2 / CGMCC 5302) TaxID=933388 RepID=S8ARC2_PENO1|nr:hypothetical protein PDE_03504 [Penicillium oxalicum 114-2]
MAAVYDEKSGPLTAPPAAQPSSIKKESDIPDPAAEELVKADDIPAVRSSHESAPPLRIVANDHQSEGSYEELPHNLGTTFVAKKSPASDLPSAEVSRKSQDHFDDKAGVNAVVSKDKSKLSATTPQEQATQGDAPKKKAKKSSYGLTPGETPFPDFKAPTPEVCRKVNDLLSQAHGKVIAPKTIPEPSLTVTGCGEVPSVLDALIRTLLSGATTGTNSARAFNGLVQRFGTLEDGIGKGSVNWDAVRQAPLKDVFKAIERGGLADVKSKNLKKLLDQVYEENQERKHRHDTEDTLVMDQKNSDSSSGDTKEAEKVKEYDIATVNEHFLNLQYLHKYKTVDALKALIRYPGIGPKTAACVLLFCLQRPCFAVDTHIFRICKWLGWVPPNANEITAFSHLDVRIPDDLKYSLHQLLIKHGKQCPRCRAITSPSSADWDKGCVIEDFVKRSGRKVLEKPHARAETGASKKISAQVKKDVNTTSKSKKPSRSSVKSAGKTRAITRASSESEDTMSDLTDNSSEDNMEIDDSGESTSDQDQKAPSRNLKRKRGGVKASTGLRQQPEAKAASSKKKSNMKQAEGKIKPAKPLTAPTRRSSRLNRV